MRYVTFSITGGPPRLGAVDGDGVVDLSGTDGLPRTMLGLIEAGPPGWEAARRALGERNAGETHPLDTVRIHAPLSRPSSLRDFYAFEAHVRTAFDNRGRQVPPEWYEFPAFYFSNPGSVCGPDETIAAPPGSSGASPSGRSPRRSRSATPC